MFQGSVLAIGIAERNGEPMRSVDQVRAVAGKGLEGDRYFSETAEGLVTLIAAEAIEAMARDTGYQLDYTDARRNIVTRDVPLNELVDEVFDVGGVRLRGVRLSERVSISPRSPTGGCSRDCCTGPGSRRRS